MQNTDILNLPGWQIIACDASEDRYLIQANPCHPRCACPACGSLSTAKHGRQPQQLHDLPCHGKLVTIHFDRQRSRCLVCRKTWFEILPEVDEQRRATARLVRYVQKQSLTRTFVSVAAETGLDERSVRNWFADAVAELERITHRPTPQIMGLDEIYLLGQPRAVFTNLETHRIVEMLPERKKEYIGRYFETLAGKETVSVVVIDMHRPYLDLILKYFPQAHPVIDKFHVLRQLGEVVECARKEVRATLTDRQRRTLMHDRFLLHKRYKDLTAQQLLILESWLGQFPRLSAVYWRKEEFYEVYEARTPEDATTRYTAWVKKIEESQVTNAFQAFLETIDRWRIFIFAYFTYRYTGGPVEGLNALIRSVDRAGRGYSFAVLRARLLYGQHLLRQTRRPKPKACDVLEERNVDDQVGDASPSTCIQLPLLL